MNGTYLKVPKLDQRKVFPTKKDNWACWYTSVLMVLLYRMGVSGNASVMNVDTLKRLFDNKGLGPTEDASLARECGLEHSPSKKVLEKRSFDDYSKALSNLGPLVMSTASHVIVATGNVKDVTGKEHIFKLFYVGYDNLVPVCLNRIDVDVYVGDLFGLC
jgi:hypothetical protein